MKKLYLMIGLSFITVGALTACSKPAEKNTTPATSSQTTTSSSTNSETTKSSIKTKDEQSDLSKVKVTVKEVVELYQQAHPDSDITSLELESPLGALVYKVEGMDDEQEYEMVIDAMNKKVEKNHSEKLDRNEKGGTERKEEALDVKNLISVDKAISIAESAAGFGKATELSLDKELSITFWDVTVKEGMKEMEIKLNAQTGDVVESKKD